ncbi:MAG: hypothetical protein K2X38_00240 [Gemmataceae bacterium]|nr:hypothetical protein [Gemmataceae bacterium]
MAAVSQTRPRGPQTAAHKQALEDFGEAVREHGIAFAIEFLTLATGKLNTTLLRAWTRQVLQLMEEAKAPNGEDTQPTEAEPGSDEKLALMERRLASGMSLHHHEDRKKLASPLPRLCQGPRRRGWVKDDPN